MGKYCTVIGWNDVPHLTQQSKEELHASIPASEREARESGIPYIGAGLIYPYSRERIQITPFALPHHFKHLYAFDTGWKWNAVVWMAKDTFTGTLYIYDNYKQGRVEPSVVASAITSRGSWIPGVADAADVRRDDGKQYFEIYKALGLNIELPNKAFDTGITRVQTAFTDGKLRIFATCIDLLEELATYARNEKGLIPEEPRHDLLDALRYAVMSIDERGIVMPSTTKRLYDIDSVGMGDNSWMG